MMKQKVTNTQRRTLKKMKIILKILDGIFISKVFAVRPANREQTTAIQLRYSGSQTKISRTI